MALLTTNDKELLENLYDRYSGLVWHVAMEIVEDDRAAEDLTQDTFLKVAEQIEKIGIVDALQTKCFLMTIIRRKCLDFFRRKKSKGADCIDTLDTFVDESPEPLDRIIEAEECSTLRRAFRKLDEDTRQILYLRFVAELTNPEIAKALNISTQYVAVKVLRATKALKKAMEMEEGKYGERQTF